MTKTEADVASLQERIEALQQTFQAMEENNALQIEILRNSLLLKCEELKFEQLKSESRNSNHEPQAELSTGSQKPWLLQPKHFGLNRFRF